jgi:glycosyltransferase involved in cell wall biosynthesis/SAM-dependent methyltransferase
MNDPAVRLLMIVPSLRMGGAERQAVALANALSRDRFRVHLVTFEKEMDLLGELDTGRVVLTTLARKAKFDRSAAAGIARIIREEDIDVVHCTLQIGYLFGWLGRRRSGKKPALICALHTTVNRDLKDDLFDRVLYGPLLGSSTGIITVCRNQQATWSRRYPWLGRKIRTVPNGVDPDRFHDEMDAGEKRRLKASLGISEDDFVAVMNAAFRPEKGHEFALRAVQALAREGRKIKLVLIGDGDRKSGLMALSGSLGLDEHVRWLGWRRDPRPYLGLADILLLASWAETFPLSVLEALSMGKPVVATSVGGIPEVVVEGYNGVLVPPKDAGALAAAIGRIMSETGFRDRLSTNARPSILAGFTVSEMARKTGDVLAEWLGAGRREFYLIEKSIADRLRRSTPEERKSLYASSYAELFRRVPGHPQLTVRESERAATVRESLKIVGRFLNPETRLLEVGSGDGRFAAEAAGRVRTVVAVDVTREVAGPRALPANVTFSVSDGSSIPVADESVDVVFSSQLMEHLHPDDAVTQLAGIRRALVPGGIYVCVTPNALNGPHDVSRGFDDVATGLHLKEYTLMELAALFRRAGFGRLEVLVGARSIYLKVPAGPVLALERFLGKIPPRPRKALARLALFRPILGIKLAGFKEGARS